MSKSESTGIVGRWRKVLVWPGKKRFLAAVALLVFVILGLEALAVLSEHRWGVPWVSVAGGVLLLLPLLLWRRAPITWFCFSWFAAIFMAAVLGFMVETHSGSAIGGLAVTLGIGAVLGLVFFLRVLKGRPGDPAADELARTVSERGDQIPRGVRRARVALTLVWMLCTGLFLAFLAHAYLRGPTGFGPLVVGGLTMPTMALFFLKKPRPDELVTDEREKLISAKAALAGAMAFCIFVVLVCFIPWVVYEYLGRRDEEISIKIWVLILLPLVGACIAAIVGAVAARLLRGAKEAHEEQ